MACLTPVPADSQQFPSPARHESGEGVGGEGHPRQIRDKRPAHIALPLGPERENALNRLANGLKQAKTG